MTTNKVDIVFFPQWTNTPSSIDAVLEKREPSSLSGNNKDNYSGYFSYLKKRNITEDDKATDYFF